MLAVARVWRYRERIEREAADLFARLAGELEALDAEPAVIELARRAAADERDHALRCRRLVERFEPGLEALAPAVGIELGPPGESRRRRALYAAVAISCVTETLSAALLLRMRERARDPVVRETVHAILKDEIAHSRLGWAHLAAEARGGDVRWLGPHLPAMLREAMAGDLAPMTVRGEANDLAAYGILSRVEVVAIYRQTITAVIRPGLERSGIQFSP